MRGSLCGHRMGSFFLLRKVCKRYNGKLYGGVIMKHTKKIEMGEIRYKHTNLDKVLGLAKDLMTFGVDVELTTDTVASSCLICNPFEVEYLLTATCSKGIWMSVLLHRKK
jgi:hypothetical protein